MLITNGTEVEEISRMLSNLCGKGIHLEAKNIFVGNRKLPFWSMSGTLESSEVYISDDDDSKNKAEIIGICMQINGLRFGNPLLLKRTDGAYEIKIKTLGDFSESVE